MKTSRKLAVTLAVFAAGSIFYGSPQAQAAGIDLDGAKIAVSRHHGDRVPPPPPEMHRPRGHRMPPPEMHRPREYRTHSEYRIHNRDVPHQPEHRRPHRPEDRPRRHR